MKKIIISNPLWNYILGAIEYICILIFASLRNLMYTMVIKYISVNHEISLQILNEIFLHSW